MFDSHDWTPANVCVYRVHTNNDVEDWQRVASTLLHVAVPAEETAFHSFQRRAVRPDVVGRQAALSATTTVWTTTTSRAHSATTTTASVARATSSSPLRAHAPHAVSHGRRRLYTADRTKAVSLL